MKDLYYIYSTFVIIREAFKKRLMNGLKGSKKSNDVLAHWSNFELCNAYVKFYDKYKQTDLQSSSIIKELQVSLEGSILSIDSQKFHITHDDEYRVKRSIFLKFKQLFFKRGYLWSLLCSDKAYYDYLLEVVRCPYVLMGYTHHPHVVYGRYNHDFIVEIKKGYVNDLLCTYIFNQPLIRRDLYVHGVQLSFIDRNFMNLPTSSIDPTKSRIDNWLMMMECKNLEKDGYIFSRQLKTYLRIANSIEQQLAKIQLTKKRYRYRQQKEKMR